MTAQNNPIPPARPVVLSLAGLDKEPAEHTFRDVLEWHKNIVRMFEAKNLGEPRPAEAKALEQSWTLLVTAVADREGVPHGFLSYMLDQLAQAELLLHETAESEYQEAAAIAEQR